MKTLEANTLLVTMKKKFLRWIIIGTFIGLGGFFVGAAHIGRFRGNAISSEARVQKCQEATEKKYCWQETLATIIREEGLDKAFTFLDYLYRNDATLAAPCHELSHQIGRTAYELFTRDKVFAISVKTAYCSFGFYHGFMEMLIARGGSVATARDFCRFVDNQLGKVTPNARFACYHGIGHGMVDIHNPQYKGDERALIREPLALCEQFAQDGEQRKLCATGVFDSISIAYYNQQNGLIMRKDDPLWLCREQLEKFKEACYLDMMPAMLWLGNYDLNTAAPLVSRFTEERYREIAIQAVADGSIRFIMNKKEPTIYLSICRSLGSRLHLSCIGGLGSGIMQFGAPDIEYVRALEFCRSDALTKEERSVCVASVISYARGRYSHEKFQSICAQVDTDYPDTSCKSI